MQDLPPLPATHLRTDTGASAVVAEHGAHLLSWIPADGAEALFLSAASRYGEGDAIRGGVPIIFPQFGQHGAGQRHGFARNVRWRPVPAADADGHAVARHSVARYCLTNDDTGDQSWPHRFELGFEVRLDDRHIELVLDVHNPSIEPWQFCAALHTYLRIDPHAVAVVEGLQGTQYLDQSRNGEAGRQSDRLLRIDGEVDRIYLDPSSILVVHDRQRSMEVRQSGFADTVVWNPGADKGNALADLITDAHRCFVCIEAATVARPVVLDGGGRWRGTQVLRVQSK